jgi:hypothetical protein
LSKNRFKIISYTWTFTHSSLVPIYFRIPVVIPKSAHSTPHDCLFDTLFPCQCPLKGQSREIFYLWFIHQTIPLGPLIHGLKSGFQYRFVFAEKSTMKMKLLILL